LNRHAAVLFGCAALMGGVVAACGSDDSSGGGGATSSSSKIEGAKVIDPKSMNGAKGTVTLCTGKDTLGDTHDLVDRFNAAKTGVTVKLTEFSPSADQQREQFIQRQQAKSGDCDLFSSDVVWTAEFATQKWLYEMSPYIESRKSEFVPSTFDTISYRGGVWGVPWHTDAAFLYYRKDKVSSVPPTWQDVYKDAASKGGIVYQGAAYEGLTCDFLELAYAAGGQVLSPDGKKVLINSPENVQALQFMMDGIKNKTAPKAVITYMETESRNQFVTGKPAYLRTWPGDYSLITKAPKVKGKVAVAPFPSFEGAGKAGILGGHNLVISVYSKNPGGALKLVDFATGPEMMKLYSTKYAEAPVLNATYEDPAVKKALPFAPQLKQAVAQAKARPVSEVYTQISQAIYNNVNAALAGRVSAQDAMKTAQSQMEKAIATF